MGSQSNSYKVTYVVKIKNNKVKFSRHRDKGGREVSDERVWEEKWT